MGCCGQKRDSLRAQPTTNAYVTTRPSPPVPARLEPGHRPIAAPQTAWRLLRYLGRSPVTVRGSASGRIYSFGPRTPVQTVDERDVAALLATGAFAAAGA